MNIYLFLFQDAAESAVVRAVDIEFPEFQFLLVDDDISEHSQLRFLNSVPHFGQRTMMLPLPLGIRIFRPHPGHL